MQFETFQKDGKCVKVEPVVVKNNVSPYALVLKTCADG